MSVWGVFAWWTEHEDDKSGGIAGVRVEVWTEYLPERSLSRYSHKE